MKFLHPGASGLTVRSMCCHSVTVFIVIPLTAGMLTRRSLLRLKGRSWFEQTFLPRLHPAAVRALLLMLVLIFAFQADTLTGRLLHVVLITVPILIQACFNASLVYVSMRLLRVDYATAAPGALVGASNFFGRAVATAITLFGPESGAVVGVLVEVPLMLSVCAVSNQTRRPFDV